MPDVENRAARIAALNDQLRTTFQGGEVLMTRGIQGSGQVAEILAKVRSHRDWGEDSDPHHEHDFGVIRHDGERIYWKIDYYDRDLCGGEDPLSPNCRRVLTVMLAMEY